MNRNPAMPDRTVTDAEDASASSRNDVLLGPVELDKRAPSLEGLERAAERDDPPDRPRNPSR